MHKNDKMVKHILFFSHYTLFIDENLVYINFPLHA